MSTKNDVHHMSTNDLVQRWRNAEKSAMQLGQELLLHTTGHKTLHGQNVSNFRKQRTEDMDDAALYLAAIIKRYDTQGD